MNNTKQQAQTTQTISSASGADASLPTMRDVKEADREQFRLDYANSMKTIFKEYAQHEIFYKTLCLVKDESDEDELSKDILALPEMKYHLRAPRFYLDELHSCGSLQRIPLGDAKAGTEPDETAVIGGVASDLPSDAADTAADSETACAAESDAGEPADDSDVDEAGMPRRYTWYLTPVGASLIDDLSPVSRLNDLLDEQADVESIYLQLLDYCKTPRTRVDVENFLNERQDLEGLGVVASFFLDRLEQNGGIVWKDGWKTTPEGEVCLTQRTELEEQTNES